MSDSIKVAIKVRPLIKREKDENLQVQWTVVDNVIVPADPEKKRGESGFQFDHIFDSEKTNNHVFDIVVKPIVIAAVRGFNGTVFAYGQTSSGKTHTMLGTPNEPGIIPMAVDYMFDAIAETRGREFLLRVSYLEIYNEKVNDLLDTTAVDLKLREDNNGLVQVMKCKEEIANSPDLIMAIMKKGDKNRRIGETDMNDRSSRSHTIFRITIESRDQVSDSDGAVQVAQLNLVDLAGSERARQTNATGERFKEGTHINMSLSTLALVIKQLSESSDTNKYINFRDSKLTRLLQASLGGNAMTVIICAITPVAYEETQCTLWFASRAKSVKNKPQLNEVMSDAALLKRYKKQIAKLHEELEKAKYENRIADVQEMESKLQEKENKLQETGRLNQLLEERIQLLENSIISTDNAVRNDNSSKIPRSKRRRTWAGDQTMCPRFSLYSKDLPTIKENCCISPEAKPNKIERRSGIRNRKSIIQTVDLNDESFETAFADFELDMIKVVKEREEQTNNTLDFIEENKFLKGKSKTQNQVKFQDNIEICHYSNGSVLSDLLSPEKEKLITSIQDTTVKELSPGTPKSVLRARLNYITEEYKSLQEFTSFERQMLYAEQIDFNSHNEKIFMQKQIDELLERLRKYNLDQLRIQNEKLVLENTKIKSEIIAETNKLKNSNILIKTLTVDTDHLMGKLLEKNNELLKLKERIVELERTDRDSNKSIVNNYETSTKKECYDDGSIQQLPSDVSQEKENEILRLNEVIQAKTLEITKYKENEEEMKMENESLRKTLDANLKIVQISKECQMDIIPENKDENNDYEMNAEIDHDVSKASKLTQEPDMNIVKYKELQKEMEKKIKELHSLDTVKVENKSQESQTEDFLYCENKNTLLVDQMKNTEISRLEKIIQEKSFEMKKYMQFEEEAKEEFYLNNTNEIKKISDDFQTQDILKNEFSKIQEDFQEINQKTEQFQEHLENISKIKETVEEYKVKHLVDKNHVNSSCEDQINGVGYQQIIENNNIEIKKYKQMNEEMGMKIKNLQETLDKIIAIKHRSIDCQTEIVSVHKEIDSNKEFDKDITNLTEIIQIKENEIAQFKLSEEERIKEIKHLQEYLDTLTNIHRESKECQAECISSVDEEKSNEIHRLSKIIEENSLEITTHKQLEDKLTKEIEHLKECANRLTTLEYVSKEVQTEAVNHDHEKIKSYQEEIVTLINTNEEFEARIISLNNQLSVKIKDFEELRSLIDVLKNEIIKKTNEMSKLQQDVEIRVQKFEEKIDIVTLEKNKLKAKINHIYSANLIKDFKDEDLKIILDESELENEKLRKQVLKTQSIEELNLSMTSTNSLRSPLKSNTTLANNVNSIISPTKLNATVSVSNVSDSVKDRISQFNENNQSVVTLDENKTTSMDSNIFLKPTNFSILEQKDLSSKLNVSVNDNSLVKSSNKKFELESSSIFANITYFDEMECSQSFIQDNTSLLTTNDESKNISILSTNINIQLANDVTKTDDVNDISELFENNDVSVFKDTKTVSPIKIKNEPHTIEELKKIRVNLEKENANLCNDLQKKIHETEEVERAISDVNKNLIKLQQTVFILTNENMEMSKQLSDTREQNDEIVRNLQMNIANLTNRLLTISEEKDSLKDQLAILHDQLENMSSITPVITDEELKYKVSEYQEKIKSLTKENIDLSTNLMDKIEELEKVKESQIQLNDHQCSFKETSEMLAQKIEYFEKKNIEISDELIESNEDCDILKETVDILKQELRTCTDQENPENYCRDNAEFIKKENKALKCKLIELEGIMSLLSKENNNLLVNMLGDSDKQNGPEIICENDANVSKMKFEESMREHISNEINNYSLMHEKIRQLQKENELLIVKNKKLEDLTLKNCSQCAHFKELNECRRNLKLENQSLNLKIDDLKRKFQLQCTDAESLRAKANEDFNISLNLMDSTLNGSIYDGMNLTLMEEKVRNLQNELEESKENDNALSNQFNEKYNEQEKLQLSTNSFASPIQEKDRKRLDSNMSSRNLRMQIFKENLDRLSNDIKEIKRSSNNHMNMLNKLKNVQNDTVSEIESLKLSNEELKKERDTAKANALNYEEKINLLEEELATLYKQIEAARITEKSIEAQKLEIEVKLESLLKEKEELVNSLQITEIKFRKELDDCNSLVHKYDKENVNLINKLESFEGIVEQSNKKNSSLEEKLQEEIKSAKSQMINEIKHLTSLSEKELKKLLNMSINDIFLRFVNDIVSKENEVVKKLHENFEKTKLKLEEEKQQSFDSEKRTKTWAQALESDLERIQVEFAEQENKKKRLQDESKMLKESLKEAQHENQQLQLNITNLEKEFNSLHNELEKKSKLNDARDSVINAVQEKQRIAKTKEEEWEARLQHEKEEYERQLKELNSQLGSYKSTNDDLKSTIEGLDIQIEHLKNTIDIKTNEFMGSKHKIQTMIQEIEHFEEINQQLKNENSEKNKHIEEITDLLKIKCDLLTEFKTKVETMKPEYESLQSQIVDRKISIEKCKEEIHNLKLENKKQIDILQDKLSSEEIKSKGLNKQLHELKNKNTTLYSTLEECKDRCLELERENETLNRKVRNSTSKIRVKNEIQDLQDEIRLLKNHLEGSYNRIKELQETKSQVQWELTEVQGKNELLEQELNTTKMSLESLRDKYNNVNLQKLREKYEALLREKNNVILEIEDKKMLIANKNQKLVECSIEVDTLQKQKESLNTKLENIKGEKSVLESRILDLVNDNEELKEKIIVCNIQKDEIYKTSMEEKNQISIEFEIYRNQMLDVVKKNNELNDEMDELVGHIHKQENEIAELQDRLITGSSNERFIEKLRALEEDNEKLKIDLRVTELNHNKLQNEVVRINSEKQSLVNKIEVQNNKITELKCKVNSCTSQTSQMERRRSRRSDRLNQNRNLDVDCDSKEMTDSESPITTPTQTNSPIHEECQSCCELRNRIREMSVDLVSRNTKITMLEVQLREENFPYQTKCNELQEKLIAVKTRNSELKLEVKKLQQALVEDDYRECQICRQKKTNKRDQSVQVNAENKICMTGMSSGIVEDHLRLEKMEKERNLMKDLCRNRARKIKELEQYIKELEGLRNC
ncbi:PREDICTED: major antigen-like [Ceratosolen solmsi marchali]|uniref:Major antigen-like n=1 Tax=Ceratosolen solmsi marchali TaxID=326594 RepID=A0AAJ6YPT1_9HYME|nr:PREDICTED: major antigen-like [Ceratosolen solmsi marchali]